MDITRFCAQKIKQLRELRNFTQGYVADELDISQNAYSLIESGTTKITLDRLVALAKVLNVSPLELIQESYNETKFQHTENHSATLHSNYPPALSELEKRMYEQTILRLEQNIEKLYELIEKLTTKIANPNIGLEEEVDEDAEETARVKKLRLVKGAS